MAAADVTASCRDFPGLRINIDENNDDIRALLHDINPSWVKQDIQFEILSGGYSSDIFRCFSKSNPNDAITVRVRRLLNTSNAPHSDPEFEVKTLKELSRVGLFPSLHATFQNGYCYTYLKGQPVGFSDVKEVVILSENLIKLISRELASVHLAVVPGADYTRTPYFANMAALLDNDQLAWDDDWPSRKELIQEVDVIKDYATAANSPLVLCHGDFHPGNMVWDKEQDQVTFVDWELAYVGHRACDIAYYLNVIEYVNYLRGVPYVPTPDLERLFCQYYLERFNEIRCTDNSNKDTVQDDMQQLLLEVKRFKLVVIFQWLIYVVAFWETTKKLGPDTAKIVKYNVDRYLNTKEEAFGFRRFGR